MTGRLSIWSSMISAITGLSEFGGCLVLGGHWSSEGTGMLFFWEKTTRFAQTSFSRQKSIPAPSGKPECMRSGIFEGRYESQGEGGPSKSVRSQGWRSPSVPRTGLKRLLEGPPSSWLGARQKAVKVQ